MDLIPDNWASVLALETPLLELATRGVLLYVGILMLLRIMPRRTAGEVAAMDLVLILLITESASHALGDFQTVGDGLVQILVVALLALLVNMASFHLPFVRKLVEAPPLKIVHNGRILRRNMRREFITDEELYSCLRENGISDLAQVRSAHVESEGHITVVGKNASE